MNAKFVLAARMVGMGTRPTLTPSARDRGRSGRTPRTTARSGKSSATEANGAGPSQITRCKADFEI